MVEIDDFLNFYIIKEREPNERPTVRKTYRYFPNSF
jgi:hypothetical protein